MRTRPLALSVSLLVLAACGGGAGGGGGGSAARLVALEVSAGELAPTFAPDTTAYAAGVGVFARSVRIRPTAADPASTILVNGAPVASGEISGLLPLVVGPSDVDVEVTAPDGSTLAYTVTFVRAAAASQEAYVKASNSDQNDGFGQAVALWDHTLLVGAPHEGSAARGVNGDEADNSDFGCGAVYVYVRTGTTWTKQAYLKPFDNDGGGSFGTSVDLDGDVAVVGAAHENTGATNSGAAFVFRRVGTTWTPDGILKAPFPSIADEFGITVAVSGNTIVVGAPHEDSAATGVNGNENDESASTSGAAYVFVHDGVAWVQQAYLKASNAETNDKFGSSVAILGDTVVVGAVAEASNANVVDGNQANNAAYSSGAAYVFVRNGTTWTQQAYLKASNSEGNDDFGTAVAIAGNTIVVGAPGEDSNAEDVGGDETDNSSVDSGAAYVFVRNGGTWSQQAYLKPLDADPNDAFSFLAVAISADTIAIGAWFEDSDAVGINGGGRNDLAAESGCVNVYSRTAGIWTRQAYLKSSNSEAADRFGVGVDVFGDTVVAGATDESSDADGVNGNQALNGTWLAGAVYVIR